MKIYVGHASEPVSKQTDYVVVGEAPGSKAQRVEKLGITILAEKQFLELIK